MKIFYFFLVFHYAALEPLVEFPFNATALGHSGLLITWKPITGTQSEKTSGKEYYFRFKEYRVEEKKEDEFEFSDYKNNSIEEHNYEFNETRYTGCFSSAGQFKIHSLNESTLYEIIIQHQYDDPFRTIKNGSTIVYTRDPSHSRRYTVKMRTGIKSTKIPAKPSLEYDMFKGTTVESLTIIKWYPCGRERICSDDQESGTHFGIRIREPYNSKKWIEVEEEEFYFDNVLSLLWPGRMYEVVVFSINGAQRTDSDTQEIFIKPMFTMVQYVNVISLPDLSVLISWKPPRHVHDAVVEYSVIYSDHRELNADKEAPVMMRYNTIKSVIRSFISAKYEQIRISGLKFELMYNFIILPVGVINTSSHLGLEYRGRFQLQAYNEDLPIARPDFNYKLLKVKGGCVFTFNWLPCGHSYNCGNTRPGSEYYFEFSPKPYSRTAYKENGIFTGGFELRREYNVHLTSSIGKNSSEPMIKYFKDCDEIYVEKYAFKRKDEL